MHAEELADLRAQTRQLEEKRQAAAGLWAEQDKTLAAEESRRHDALISALTHALSPSQAGAHAKFSHPNTFVLAGYPVEGARPLGANVSVRDVMASDQVTLATSASA